MNQLETSEIHNLKGIITFGGGSIWNRAKKAYQ